MGKYGEHVGKYGKISYQWNQKSSKAGYNPSMNGGGGKGHLWMDVFPANHVWLLEGIVNGETRGFGAPTKNHTIYIYICVYMCV